MKIDKVRMLKCAMWNKIFRRFDHFRKLNASRQILQIRFSIYNLDNSRNYKKKVFFVPAIKIVLSIVAALFADTKSFSSVLSIVYCAVVGFEKFFLSNCQANEEWVKIKNLQTLTALFADSKSSSSVLCIVHCVVVGFQNSSFQIAKQMKNEWD